METKEEVQKEPGQWLQRSKLINLISHTYFQAAFSAIRVMLSLLSIYRKSFSVIGMISGITYALDHYVPPEYLTWYHAVMGRARHAIFQAVFKLILHCFVSKQSLDAVQKYLTPYLNPIESIGQLLNEQQPLSFDVNGTDNAATFPPQLLETHAPSFSLDEGTVHQTLKA